MNNTIEAIKDGILKSKPRSSNTIKFNQKLAYLKPDEYCCFVEGSTDPNFYSNISNYSFIKHIKFDNYLYINGKMNEISGKMSVINSYLDIKELFDKYMSKCVFIVDHDYYGYSDLNLPKNNHISMTEPYSFENYFLIESNIKKIFDYYNINQYYDNFIKMFNEFLQESDLYNCYKFSTTRYFDLKGAKFNYKKLYSPEEIFYFKFSNSGFSFNKEKMDKEIHNIKNAIERWNQNPGNNIMGVKNDINYTYKKYSKKQENFVGHTVYDFLDQYLRQVHNININNDYDMIVPLLDVKMLKIQDGTGKLLN